MIDSWLDRYAIEVVHNNRTLRLSKPRSYLSVGWRTTAHNYVAGAAA